MLELDVLFKQNPDGSYKVWAQCGGHVCHGKALGSSKGLSVKRSTVTKESKLKNGYKMAVVMRDEKLSVDAFVSHGFLGVVAGICRAVDPGVILIPRLTIEGKTAMEMRGNAVNQELLEEVIHNNAPPRTFSNMLFMYEDRSPPKQAPWHIPPITLAVTRVDAAWDF